MSNVDQKQLAQTLSREAENRFVQNARVQAAEARYDEAIRIAKAVYAEEITAVDAETTAIDATLWNLVKTHYALLFKASKRSFATLTAIFQMRKVKASIDVLDKAEIMAVARRHGLVKRLATLSVQWNFNKTKFLQLLKDRPELFVLFADYIEELPEHDSLSIKPNEGHTVIYDGKRISPPSITIVPPES